MKYSVEDLISQKKEWKQEDFIFFWKVDKKEEINKSCLSPWYPVIFFINAKEYESLEKYLTDCQYKLHGGDYDNEYKFLGYTNNQIKKYNKSLKKYTSDDWEVEQGIFLDEGNFAKFSQNEDLRNFLVSTEGKILVYANPNDSNLGIGMKENSSDAILPSKWKGLNLLGFSLMKIRDKIIKGTDVPEFYEEKFYNSETDEIETILRFNENYIPPAFILREEKFQEMQEYNSIFVKKDPIKEREKENEVLMKTTLISPELKQLIKDNPEIYGIKKIKDSLTNKELKYLFETSNRIGCNLHIENTEEDIGLYTFHWHFYWNDINNVPSYNSQKIFKSYVEAFEEAMKEFAQRVEKSEDGRYFFIDSEGNRIPSWDDFISMPS